MDIQLNFINQSQDANNSQVVIFQKNLAASVGELAVAWKVISGCKYGESHPFTYASDLSVTADDSAGNLAPLVPAVPGQQFELGSIPTGPLLSSGQPFSSSKQINVRNMLPVGSITAQIYKTGVLLATSAPVPSQQTASFQFAPSLWIGVAQQAVQGQPLSAASVQNETELSLAGISSADIVMTGGGADPFKFTITNTTPAT